MIETVGKVKLDLKHYPGEDLYCDGAVEDELLEAVKNGNGDYRAVIEEKNNWPFLYHLSRLRGNIIDWFPVAENAKVLEIGAGCGAITGTIADKCAELTCVDLSKKRSLINAYRNKDKDNITIKVGNFQDIEPELPTDYDLILLIGVFEYAAAYINSESPYTEFMNIIQKHVKSDGNVVIAIENRMGMKYLAGCREDHLGNYFSGIENYPDGGVVRTFTRPALEKILKESGIANYSFYYPYPDYKFMDCIYSDDRLPVRGELSTNLRNFDRDRLLLFDEKLALDSVIDDGEFSLFSNSYLLVTGPKKEVIYSKLSKDRDEKYAIRTDIVKTANGLKVYKSPAYESAKAHIETIYNAYEMLVKRYEGSGLSICNCNKTDSGALEFDYIQGVTLEEKLDSLLDKPEEISKLIKEYYEKISYGSDGEYGDVQDMDMIFSNIIIDDNGCWQLIDYEWTERKKASAKDILNRAVYCYQIPAGKRASVDFERIIREIAGEGIEYQKEKLNQDEIKFQKLVTGSYQSLSTIRDSINNQVLPVVDAIMIHENNEREKQVQIYLDRGRDFNEADSLMVMPERTGQECLITIKLTREIVKLRLDPKMKPCIISDISAYIDKNDGSRYIFPLKKLNHNGVNMPEGALAFNHNDPNVTFDFKIFRKYSTSDGDEMVISYKELTQ